MRRIMKILTVILMTVLLLTSCGSVSKMQKVLDTISIEATFPEPASGFTSIDEVGGAVYEQQLALCEAYGETYKKTSYGLYENKFRNVTKQRLMSELNNARNRLNNECVNTFADNVFMILKDVQDCQNMSTYISKRRNEVLEFYLDYADFKLEKGDIAAKRSAILLKYFEKQNEFAVSFIKNNRDAFIDACVEIVERNGEKKDNLRVHVDENNRIIKALNDLFDGTTMDVAKRVNVANRKLAETVLKDMDGLTEEEKKEILKGIDRDYQG